MKIVGFGPGRRTGALRDGLVVDLVRAFAKYALQRLRRASSMGAGGVLGPAGGGVYREKANRLDYEGELAIVLGKRGADIKPENAGDYVWGVTLLGDWSIRSPREPAGPHNFAMGKNFDTSCSLGPCISVGETEPFATDVETLVNGEVRQAFNTRDMVFSFCEYLEYLSRDR